MFLAVLFIQPQIRDKSQSTEKQANRRLVYYTMECYLAMKNNKLLIHTTVWVNAKTIMLRSLKQKSSYWMSPFLWSSRTSSTYLQWWEWGQWLPGDCGGGSWLQTNTLWLWKRLIPSLWWWLPRCMYLSKLTEYYALNECILLSTNYTSMSW